MSGLIQQNFVLMHRFQSEASKILQTHLREQREKSVQSLYQVVSAKNGQPCLVKQKQPDPVYLHSLDNPVQEVVTRFQNVLRSNPDWLVVYSSGLGFFLPVLQQWIQDHKLIIVEPDVDILFEALRVSDWRGVLQSPNFHLSAGETAVDDVKNLFQKHPALLQNKIQLVPGRIPLQEDQSFIHGIQQVISKPSQSSHASAPNVIVCGDAHDSLVHPLVTEADTVNLHVAGKHRPNYINRFLHDTDILHDTVGEPFPKQVMSFTKHMLRNDEWKALHDAGVKCCLWCYDDPFRAGVDETFFQNLDTVFCYDPFIAGKLKTHSSIPIQYLPAGTAFSRESPLKNSVWTDQQWDVTFVGSTGLQRHDDVLTQWITKQHPICKQVNEMVNASCGQGKPVAYDELFSIPVEQYGINPKQKTVYLQDMATFLVRRYFLSTLNNDALTIFGDVGWKETAWVQSLESCFGGRSLNYNHETPYVYANSKINLNLFNIQCVNSPTIRMFDVMACGGFLLTEYRPFMDDLFEIGKHLDVFHTREELQEKVQYYMHHEEERKQIALEGQQLVLDKHRYRFRLQEIFGRV